MEAAEQMPAWPEVPVPSEVTTSPLVERIRRGIIGEGEVMDGPFGGHIDLADLECQLARYARRPLLIGSFSAASNVTGILTDTGAVAALLHAHGALSFWDYAAAGPYGPIRVAASRPGAGDRKDAVFLSPHKFPGGPRPAARSA
jgi:hypothetical protein